MTDDKPKRAKTTAIEISFKEPVDIADDACRMLHDALNAICEDYEDANPGRVMWVFGSGAKPPPGWPYVDDGSTGDWNMSVETIEITERERYDTEKTRQRSEMRRWQDERHKLIWQVRDTCARAEKAEADLAVLRANPPSALAGTIPEITWVADDETHGLIDQLKAKLGVSTTAEVFREALRRASALAGTRPDPASPSREELIEALSDMLQAVCGETGFAACVRSDSRTAYPWPALDIAEAKARSLLTTSSAGTEGE
jgi:hypothetical protein